MSPTQAARLCPTPGCAHIVYGRGACKPCRRSREKRRPSAAKRGYGRRWRNFRRQILARDPICKKCDVAESKHVDHIVPISRGGEQYDPENCQGLCARCHSHKTATEDGGFGR